MNIGFVGEQGYELHVESKHCVSLYNMIMTVGSKHGLKNAGFRALRSLSCEKGTKTSIIGKFARQNLIKN